MRKNLFVFLMVGAAIIAKRKTIMGAIISTDAALADKNVLAFLAMIRQYESRGDYAILYGGGHFADMSDHPNVRVPFLNPKTAKNDYSTAAGAYQINHPTWLFIRTLAQLPDFSPASQDRAAVLLLKADGALYDIAQGRFEKGVEIASQRWASLPFSVSMQNKTSLQNAIATYTRNGGLLA